MNAEGTAGSQGLQLLLEVHPNSDFFGHSEPLRLHHFLEFCGEWMEDSVLICDQKERDIQRNTA